MLGALADLFFPPACAGCRAAAPELFCSSCTELVEVLPSWRCPVCSGNLAPPIARGEEPGRCPACAARPPAFHAVASPFVYGGPVTQAIHRLKYRGERSLARRLAAPMAEAGRDLLEGADAVVHVPLHPARRRERGFDQALLLASAVARSANLPHLRRALVRTRPSGHQVGRGREERGAAVAEAFLASEDVRGLSLVLVDDVVTTGATADAAALALARAGARKVGVLAVARAL
jgi:ComF family protein